MRFAICLLVSAAAANAQAIFGSLQGTITDESRAVAPRARVAASNVNTGIRSSVEANDAGLYFLGELRPGVYDLEVEAPGFQRYVQRGITLRVEDRLRLDVTLKVGQVAEAIEVRAEAALIQTESNTLGRVIDESTMKQLPLRGRNAFELVLLTPGASQRGDDELPRLSGGRARTGEYVLDGGSITTPRRGQLFTQPNLDAIQEFKVQTNGLSAEFGRTVGGVVNATLKSGTNRFSGNLFEFHRNNSINARNFFSPRNAKLIQNQFGGMIGGPILRNRLFFFGDFELFRQSEERLFNLNVPTVPQKRGDFSERNIGIFDPATTRANPAGPGFVRDPFPGNIIPAARFDAPGPKVAALYPDPNRPGFVQNFQRLLPQNTDNNKFDARLDWRASEKDLVFGRYSWDHQFGANARAFAAAGTGGNNGNFNRYLTGAIGWTRTLSPTVLNDARVSFFRGIQERLLSLGAGDPLGIPNLELVGLPNFTLPGFTGLGDAQAFAPAENQYQVQNVTTIVRGRHVLKAGVDHRRFPINDLQLQFTGEYGLSANQTADPRTPGTTGNPLASLLLGHIDSFNNSTLRGRFYYRSLYFGAFFQDDFKVSSTLTLNLGLRYDVEQNPREIRNQGSNFDLAKGRPVTMA
ncbi:MAG: carboxypeptidase regulatory-like domain-containing protein, partial [Bryobacteraceae bacterium]